MPKKFIPVAEPSFGKKELAFAVDAIRSTWISSQGEYIDAFERNFAKYIGVPYAVATTNGTVAIHLALAALGVGKGDEVILPDLTFVSTANAVVYTGAKPVMVDVDPATWCMAPTALERAITPRTKVIMPVHLYGHPADMDAIVKIAKRHKVHVLEDAAEAHGAHHRGRIVGSIGTLGAFSFYGNKIITTGEGGMVVTKSKKLYERLRMLRNQGAHPSRKYWYTEVGFNYRLTNLQAAIGVAQLEQIDTFIAKKRQIAHWYRTYLAGVPDITLSTEADGMRSVYWMVCLLVKSKATRDRLRRALDAKGIETRPFFHPITDMPMYRGKHNAPTPAAHDLSRRGLNLPSGVPLTQNQVRFICAAIKTSLAQ